MPPFEAALKGSGEIGFTIISITLSLVAVFIPVLLMGGVVGRVFHEFAVMVTIAIAASAFVSLTLTPMLCARLPERHGTAGRARSQPVRARLRSRRQAATRSCSTCASGRGRSIFARLPRHRRRHGLAVPRRSPRASSRRRTSASSRSRPRRARTSRSRPCWGCRPRPRRDRAFAARGARRLDRRRRRAASTLNNGRFFVELKPKGERPELATVVADLRRELGRIPGINAFIVPVQNLSFGGRQSKSQYQFVLQGVDRAELDDWALRLADRMQRTRRSPTSPTISRTPRCRRASTSTATRPARSASPPSSSARRSTAASARARSRPSTRPATATR